MGDVSDRRHATKNIQVKRLFVVGFPRSGTTLVQNELVRNFNLVSFTESHFFFERFVCPLDRLVVPPIVADALILRRILPSRHEHFRRFYIENGLSEQSVSARAEAVSAFIRRLDAAAERVGASGWVEKTPLHLRRIPAISKTVAGAVFIHVCRKLRNVQGSWAKLRSDDVGARYFAADADEVERNWCRDMERTAHWVAKRPDRHCVVLLEDLQANAKSVLVALARWLNLEYREVPFDGTVGVEGFEHWKTRNRRPIFREGDYEDQLEKPHATNLYWRLSKLALRGSEHHGGGALSPRATEVRGEDPR